MSDSEKQAVDPFDSAEIDLSVLTKQEAEPRQANSILPDKEEIRRIAAENEFRSRQPAKPQPKAINKTFSLFPDDLAHINRAFNEVLKAHSNNPGLNLSKPSDSDIVRAALHFFAMQPMEDQLQLIKEHRGRGRNASGA